MGMTRRRLLLGAAAAAAMTAGRQPVWAQIEPSAGEAMVRAATAFLTALDARQRGRAIFPFAHEERMNWHYIPRRRQGLPFKDMPAAARTAAHDLLKAALSTAGYVKAVNVIRLEDVLRQSEVFGALLRDPEAYHVSIFGQLGLASAWGWRLEGHHLSLNFTLVAGRGIAVSPAFFGANPAEVPSGPLKGLRALAEEQDLGLALARSIDPGLRPRLVIAADSLGDIVSGPGRGESLKTPEGMALRELSGEQRALAMRLIEVYAGNMRSEVADEELRRIREAGLERVHFAWAGALEAGRPHYYRIHGPTVLIEYDNTQNAANHIHSVWHDPRGGFGTDMLRAHYEHGHHHAGRSAGGRASGHLNQTRPGRDGMPAPACALLAWYRIRGIDARASDR